METNAIQMQGSEIAYSGVHENSFSTSVDTAESQSIATTEENPAIQQETAVVEEKVGARNMLVGALWCIGGTIVTAVSYDAVRETGGTYIITWGAILFGGLQFVKGFFQLIMGK